LPLAGAVKAERKIHPVSVKKLVLAENFHGCFQRDFFKFIIRYYFILFKLQLDGVINILHGAAAALSKNRANCLSFQSKAPAFCFIIPAAI
jgi:hypothetical protein